MCVHRFAKYLGLGPELLSLNIPEGYRLEDGKSCKSIIVENVKENNETNVFTKKRTPSFLFDLTSAGMHGWVGVEFESYATAP